jgi:O-succinylbenzoic acid--CoA ligase
LAVYLPNDWRHAILLPALLRLGVRIVETNLRLPPPAVAAQLHAMHISRAVVTGNPNLPGLRLLTLPDIFAPARPAPSRHPTISLHAPAVLLFTSASTGAAKAAVLSFGNLYYNAVGSNRNIALRRGDRWQLSLPLYHVSGLGVLLRAWLAGAAVAIPELDESPTQAIARLRTTHVSLVPTQLRRMLRSRPGRAQLRQLRAVLVGGAAIDPHLLKTAYAAGIRVLPTYGMTEMASQVCTLSPYAPADKRFTSGRTLPFREVKIAADGEILVRGQARFLGYLVRGRLQRLPPTSWFATGDIGALDAQGYLTVHGRKDNQFISGGENIQPEEIEHMLLTMPGITAAVVVPRPDPEFGARPVALLRSARRVSRKNLCAMLRRRLPAYKVPVDFLPWPKQAPAALKISRPFFTAQAVKLCAARRR